MLRHERLRNISKLSTSVLERVDDCSNVGATRVKNSVIKGHVELVAKLYLTRYHVIVDALSCNRR